jgi:hypothetical protein
MIFSILLEHPISDLAKYLLSTIRIKPTGEYKDMRIYCILNVVILLGVSATFCGHLQEGALRRIYYKDIKSSVQI